MDREDIQLGGGEQCGAGMRGGHKDRRSLHALFARRLYSSRAEKMDGGERSRKTRSQSTNGESETMIIRLILSH